MSGYTAAPHDARRSAIDDSGANPDDPPPAYTPSAGPQGDTVVQAGPSRMDFSGPPPLPDRYPSHQGASHQGPGPVEAQITGVGMGYGRRDHTHNGEGVQEVYASPTGPPPRKTQTGQGGSDPFADQAGSSSTGGAGPSRPADVSPTDVAAPGRPLLRNGQLLVYPKAYNCQKCNNTGYVNADPSNPCISDWRKYGKTYNAALAASYKTSTGPLSNPTVSASSNFQQPLPHLRPPRPVQGPPYIVQGPEMRQSHPHQQSWNHYPGQNPHAYHPPPPGAHGQGIMPHLPPPPMHHQHQPPPPQHHAPGPIFVQQTPGPVPPGAIVVAPGDPRIGGRACWRCGGHGRETSFFGFDDGRCWECRGLGRVFP